MDPAPPLFPRRAGPPCQASTRVPWRTEAAAVGRRRPPCLAGGLRVGRPELLRRRGEAPPQRLSTACGRIQGPMRFQDSAASPVVAQRRRRFQNSAASPVVAQRRRRQRFCSTSYLAVSMPLRSPRFESSSPTSTRIPRRYPSTAPGCLGAESRAGASAAWGRMGSLRLPWPELRWVAALDLCACGGEREAGISCANPATQVGL